eukprot:1305816-Prymnesium_polylepis.1
MMLTKRATITRACSASPRISSTQPVSVSLVAAHLERLPPAERQPTVVGVVATQEGGRTAQRDWNARTERVAARPQQH